METGCSTITDLPRLVLQVTQDEFQIFMIVLQQYCTLYVWAGRGASACLLLMISARCCHRR